MKILKKILIVFLVIAVILAGGAGFVYFRYLKEPLELAKVISNFTKEEEMSLHVTVESKPVDGDTFTVEGDIQRSQQGDLDVFAVSNDLMNFDYCNGRIYLESGKIWNLTEDTSDSSGSASASGYSSVVKIAAVLLMKADFSSEATETGKNYTISCEGEKIAEAVQQMNIDAEELVSSLQSIVINIQTADGKITEADGTASTANGTYHFVMERSDCTVPIDSSILEKMQAGTDGAYMFSEDNLRLVRSVINLLNQPTMAMDIAIDVDFAGLKLNNSMKYWKTVQDELSVNIIEAGGISFYSANGKTVTASGTALTEEQESSASVSALPGMLIELVLNGDLSCAGTDGSYAYQMTLSQDSMKQVVDTILSADYTDILTMNQGAITLGVDEEKVTGIGVSIDGSINLLITEVSGSVGVQMTVTDETAEVPEAAMNALR